MKGIGFCEPMALAFREGRKHETRRVMNPQPQPDPVAPDRLVLYKGGAMTPDGALAAYAKYKPGEVCFVQEAWQFAGWSEDGEPQIRYSDGTMDFPMVPDDDKVQEWLVDVWAELSKQENYDIDGTAADRRWRSPRFMPAWAARTFVLIESARAERVGQIGPASVIAEGIVRRTEDVAEELGEFVSLWNRLHPKAPYRFEDDPWVWVYGLSLTEGTEGD